jgi:hypothetical protein
VLSFPPRKLAFMHGERRDQEKKAEADARAGFAERFRLAFVRAGRLQPTGEPDRAWLAREIGISVQAIGQALRPDPEKPIVLSAFTNARAARALRCDADWLATGEGRPDLDGVPPVPPSTTARLALDTLAQTLTRVDGSSRTALVALIGRLASDPSASGEIADAVERLVGDFAPFRARAQPADREGPVLQQDLQNLLDKLARISDPALQATASRAAAAAADAAVATALYRHTPPPTPSERDANAPGTPQPNPRPARSQ